MTKMPIPLKKQFLLHAKKNVFLHRVKHAKRVVREFLQHTDNPYISVSGGKDSSVLLHLVREFKPELDAVHLNFHTAYPETLDIFQTYQNLKFVDVGNRLEMLADGGMDDNSKNGKLRNFDPDRIRGMEYDGFFYGLRREESAVRRKHFGTRGFSLKNKAGIWVCQPLAFFTYEDIWAYIISHGIRYNALYDAMWDRPRHQQRVADFALVKCAELGSIAYMKQTHPELYNKVVQATDEFRRYV